MDFCEASLKECGLNIEDFILFELLASVTENLVMKIILLVHDKGWLGRQLKTPTKRCNNLRTSSFIVEASLHTMVAQDI